MTQATRTHELVGLNDTDFVLVDSAEDVRGRTVIDRHGDEIGTVNDLLIDEVDVKVRFLNVGAGGFLGIGEEHLLIPVDAITRIDEDHVHIDRERTSLHDAPRYDPAITKDIGYYEGVYGWWGVGPYWASAYRYPRYPFYGR